MTLEAEPKRMKRRWRRRALFAAVLVVVALVALELFCRLYLGLGDPPLLSPDPELEYVYNPNQTRKRFGNHAHYNAYSMRSDDFPATKPPGELRVLFIGDSIINGGLHTDQSNLMTTIIGHDLSNKLARPVVTGNASCPSWGPPNELAWLKRYGLMGADVVVVTLTSQDAYDVPTFTTSISPQHTPMLAMLELLEPWAIPRLFHSNTDASVPPPVVEPAPADVAACVAATREIFAIARAGGARCVLALHAQTDELAGKFLPGYAALYEIGKDPGIELIEFAPAFARAAKHGPYPYRDFLHPNDNGQRLMAELIEPVVERLLNERLSAGPK